MIEVYAADDQADEQLDVVRWADLTRRVLKSCGLKGNAEVALFFVDEAAISELNARFLGREGPTDVLAFPIEDDPGSAGRSARSDGSTRGNAGRYPPVLLGDVMICPSVAARHASDHGVPLEDELALLVVHGLLHLLGLDHTTDTEAQEMEREERRLLRKHHGRSRQSDSQVPEERPPGARPSMFG